MLRTCLVVFTLLALLIAGCGGDRKDSNKSVSLSQELSYVDGAVSFRLPEGWLSAPVDDRSQEAFIILNNPALMDEFHDMEDVADSAVNAFAFAYDPTYSLEESYLTTKENVVLGVVVVATIDQLGEDMNPKEIISFMVEQGKSNLQDSLEHQQEDGRTEPVYDQSVYDLDQSKIKTFKNGAFVRFKSAGNLPGMIGIVRAGENFAAIFLATDKPNQYMSMFESIIRSIKITDQPLPIATEEPIPTLAPMPTSSTPLVIVVTGTPPTSMFQDQNGQQIIVITATPLVAIPTQLAIPTAVGCSYAIQEGDTFSSIAEQFGVYIGDLFAANEDLFVGQSADTYQLEIGQEIKIPGPGCE